MTQRTPRVTPTIGLYKGKEANWLGVLHSYTHFLNKNNINTEDIEYYAPTVQISLNLRVFLHPFTFHICIS
jgi:hypothetical protein